MSYPHGPKSPDAILSDYLDDLLSAGEESPWAEESPGARESDAPQHRTQGAERKRTRARRPQASALQVKERPAPSSSLVSPAFRDIPPEAPAEAEETPPEPPVTAREESPTPQPPPAEVEPEPEPEVVAPPEPADLPREERPIEPEPWENGRPPWAQQGFECLIFRVAGLQLAVPLVLLGQIHRFDGELTPLVGRPDWFMGLLRVGDQNVRVADTALWVMPERYRTEFRDGYRFVIQLGDSAWGLACDEVAQSFHVSPDEVKWRGQGGRRQWLAGTIRKEMCALLDVARLADLLKKAETERRPDLDR